MATKKPVSKEVSQRARASRKKGQTAELQVIRLLQPYVDAIYKQIGVEAPQLQRNLMATAWGGFDVVGLKWCALEVKNHKTLSVRTWWRQTEAQAQYNQEPVLFYRKTGAPAWRVVMYGFISTKENARRCTVDIEVQDFVHYLYYRISEELGHKVTALPSIHSEN